MKVTGLFLFAMGFVAFAHVIAHKDYHLQCTREEMGIRWPSYRSNSEYYVCHRLGDRPMIVNCNAGEVFTFVLQVCTSPARYIPAPTLNVLPTSSPIADTPLKGHGAINPLGVANGVHPPLLSATQGHHNVQEIPTNVHHNVQEIARPPMVVVDVPIPPTHTVTKPNSEVVVEEEPKPQHPAKPHKPVAKPPMPPTPAPTPPLVDTDDAAKKPHAPLGKKPTGQKKTPSKKTPSKPGKATEKTKPTNAKDGKKSPKKPAKKTVAPAKKTLKAPKAPTKA